MRSRPLSRDLMLSPASRQRLGDGTQDEATLSLKEANALAGLIASVQVAVHSVDPEKLRLLEESAHI